MLYSFSHEALIRIYTSCFPVSCTSSYSPLSSNTFSHTKLSFNINHHQNHPTTSQCVSLSSPLSSPPALWPSLCLPPTLATNSCHVKVNATTFSCRHARTCAHLESSAATGFPPSAVVSATKGEVLFIEDLAGVGGAMGIGNDTEALLIIQTCTQQQFYHKADGHSNHPYMITTVRLSVCLG